MESDVDLAQVEGNMKRRRGMAMNMKGDKGKHSAYGLTRLQDMETKERRDAMMVKKQDISDLEAKILLFA